MKRLLILALGLVALASCNAVKWTLTETEYGYNVMTQKMGQTIAYSPESGVNILTVDGYAFKDLNRNGSLDAYEDWRLSAEDRAADLASQLSIEEIAGMMLYSSHQSVPSRNGMFGGATYNGKPYAESGAAASDLTDAQKKFLAEDNLRAVLVTTVESPSVAARWNNNIQAFVEGIGHGVPVNTSSDPRHETSATAEYNYGAGGEISHWPTSLGLAATFDPALVEEFGRIAAEEYRALGITTALSPQIDLATEPRWTRFYGTFGESPELDTDMARAYVDGFQTSYGEDEIAEGWGYRSVNAMVKHWPSGGPEEGGRDAHYNYGKYAVYPGGAFETHLKPFTEGAFRLNGKTEKASAVMPYYTISTGVDPSGKNVGNSYSKYIITDLLREKYGYDGVVCTDWAITADNRSIDSFDGKCWGVEELTVAQRHYECLKAGVDQFGGNNDKGPVLEAYQMWVDEFGKESADQRFKESAKRLLMNSFRTGLFENPYLDPAASAETVGKPEYMEKGYQAQLKSVVMIKNSDNVLPVKAAEAKPKVYVPQRYFPQLVNFFGMVTPERWEDTFAPELLSKYYEPVTDPAEADFAIVVIEAPASGTGYSVEDVKKGGNGYLPISLQYNDYTAESAREVSIAGGDRLEKFVNRSYKGKSVKTANKSDLQTVIDTKAAMGDKPVVTVISTGKPFVPEFEPYSDAILVSFGCQNQALLELISGTVEPSALLPMQLPANMKTVELQMEDVPFDMECYVDADGNVYDFAYGLNWSGRINDARVKKYGK
ncbi:MAG: glycoside hydrolase family 3 C-terminal domain-containing protein [Bacteroidales bacterium]|nr:glycoside hydrolase family 3 C-terminal domain-containing protein [Bacteroidales bacterium]